MLGVVSKSYTDSGILKNDKVETTDVDDMIVREIYKPIRVDEYNVKRYDKKKKLGQHVDIYI